MKVKNILRNLILLFLTVYSISIFLNIFLFGNSALVYINGIPYLFSRIFGEGLYGHGLLGKSIFYFIALLHLILLVIALYFNKKIIKIIAMFSIVISIYSGHIANFIPKLSIDAMGEAMKLMSKEADSLNKINDLKTSPNCIHNDSASKSNVVDQSHSTDKGQNY